MGGVDSHSFYQKDRKSNLLLRIINRDFGDLWRFSVNLSEKVLKKYGPNMQILQYCNKSFLDEKATSLDFLSKQLNVGITKLRLIVAPKRKGFFEVDPDQVKIIQSSSSLVVLLGFNNLLTGQILNLPLGVWSFHPADTNKYRGRPSLFFEIIEKSPNFGMTLQRLSDDIDGGPILCLRNIPASDFNTIAEARRALDCLQLGMLSQAISLLKTNNFRFPQNPDLCNSQLHIARDADHFLKATKFTCIQIFGISKMLLGRSRNRLSHLFS